MSISNTDHDRIRELERQVADLSERIASETVPNPVIAPRQVHVARTWTQSGGAYPSQPTTVYPIVFSDATFTQTVGDHTPTFADQSDDAMHVAYYAGTDFIPRGTEVIVVEQINGQHLILSPTPGVTVGVTKTSIATNANGQVKLSRWGGSNETDISPESLRSVRNISGQTLAADRKVLVVPVRLSDDTQPIRWYIVADVDTTGGSGLQRGSYHGNENNTFTFTVDTWKTLQLETEDEEGTSFATLDTTTPTATFVEIDTAGDYWIGFGAEVDFVGSADDFLKLEVEVVIDLDTGGGYTEIYDLRETKHVLNFENASETIEFNISAPMWRKRTLAVGDKLRIRYRLRDYQFVQILFTRNINFTSETYDSGSISDSAGDSSGIIEAREYWIELQKAS